MYNLGMAMPVEMVHFGRESGASFVSQVLPKEYHSGANDMRV